MDDTTETKLDETKRKRLPKPAKIALVIIACIVCIVLALLVGVNVFVHVKYADFYNDSQAEFPLPGIDSGFIPQDLDYIENDDVWLFSGYVGGDKPSPIYRRDNLGNVTRLQVVLPEGNAYTGHGSAITSTDDFVFLTCEKGYLVFDIDDFIKPDTANTVKAIDEVNLDFTPAFMNIEQGELYVGNFYFPDDYETPQEHHIPTTDGDMNMAVMYAYPADADSQYGFAPTADRVYSIPAKVQGIACTESGNIALSCSYGLASSHIPIYDTQKLEQQGTFLADSEQVPLFILDSTSLIKDIEAPPMTEGIESLDSRIYISNESASNKYIFGKLYGAGVVYSLNPDDFPVD